MSEATFSMERSANLSAITRTTRNDRIPFFVGFVPWPYQQGIPNQNGIINLSGTLAQGPDGLPVVSGGFVDFTLPIPRDMPFLLNWIRYEAWNPAVEGRGGNIDIGSRSFLAAPKTLYAVAGESSEFMAQGQQNILYNSFLSATVYLTSAGGRDQYGGMELHPQTRQAVNVPLQVQSIQGDMNSPIAMKVEALLGQNTTVSVRVYNSYTGTLNVNGVAFGYKIPAQLGSQ